MSIHMCQACPGIICHTNSDDPTCRDGKPFARWTICQDESTPKIEKPGILMIELETAQQIVQESIEAHLNIHPIMDGRIIDHIQKRMRARSLFARPDRILLCEEDAQ